MPKTIINIDTDFPSRRYLMIDGKQLGEEIVKTAKDPLKWANKQLRKRTQVSETNIARLEQELAQWEKELTFLNLATKNIQNGNYEIL